VADLPVELSDGLGERLSRILDVEGKIPRALEALGPVSGRDVLLLDRTDGLRARQLRELGARVFLAENVTSGFGVPDDSADVVVSFWSSFRGAAPAELAEAERALRPGGRLLVVHDYGRDDVSHLRGDRPEYGAWSRRGGPFLSTGFKVRVVHCFWTFESMEDCGEFLAAAFAEPGRAVAAGLKRPRLSYNVAMYHRSFGGCEASEEAIPTAVRTGDSAEAMGPAGPAKAAE
jgi:SAM-dependent methyltransferase